MKSLLIDMRNWTELKAQLIQEISQAGIIGYDIETEDSRRHAGLNKFMNVNAEGHKSKGKKLVFDNQRTTITGFSWYCDEADVAYYLNLAHADVENRIPWSEARQLLDAKPEDGNWICHNAPYELTMMKMSLDFDMPKTICTLQMAVSAFNADQYPTDKMLGCGFGGIANILHTAAEVFSSFDPYGDMTEAQADLLGKVVGKTTVAQHSYNGLVREMSFGYGLKKLTKSFFDVDQVSFATVMNGKAHMGQLTGEEVCAYGADDAYWAVKIFHRLLEMLSFQGDQLVTTFFEQENPMIHEFSRMSQNGLRINLDQVEKRRTVERGLYAEEVRKLHKIVREMLPFTEEPNSWLMSEKWYAKTAGGQYRNRIKRWAETPLPASDFDTACTTAGSVSMAWAGKKSTGPNFTHYMMMRTVMYDLAQIKPLYFHGKIGSDKEIRSRLAKKHEHLGPLLDVINEMAAIEQRMKLFLNPYMMLCDPDTQRIYPVVSSMLNSRRMAASFPNPMQLSKRGESTYIRGFYLPDEEDHVIVSIDWSQIELVLIGDFSDDAGFREAYGQLPFQDLHWKAVGDMFETDDPKSLPDAKNLRTKVGKGANFNYWYSGALSTVGEAMGWSSDKMWEMTGKYRETFAEAEEWRTDLIGEARDKGYVTLPDGHRRVKFEATYEWQHLWRQRFASAGSQGVINFGEIFIKKITNRAANQVVNSMIQGSCATLAKRSILTINQLHSQFRFRFMMPIHDELVFSVHKDDAVAFIKEAKWRMCDHPEIIRNLKVDATASVGRTFEPYHPDKAPLGQIELDEAPDILGLEKDSRLGDDDIQRVIDYLFLGVV